MMKKQLTSTFAPSEEELADVELQLERKLAYGKVQSDWAGIPTTTASSKPNASSAASKLNGTEATEPTISIPAEAKVSIDVTRHMSTTPGASTPFKDHHFDIVGGAQHSLANSASHHERSNYLVLSNPVLLPEGQNKSQAFSEAPASSQVLGRHLSSSLHHLWPQHLSRSVGHQSAI